MLDGFQKVGVLEHLSHHSHFSHPGWGRFGGKRDEEPSMRHTGSGSSFSGNRSMDVFQSKDPHFFGFIPFPLLLAQLCHLVAHPVGLTTNGECSVSVG